MIFRLFLICALLLPPYGSRETTEKGAVRQQAADELLLAPSLLLL